MKELIIKIKNNKNLGIVISPKCPICNELLIEKKVVYSFFKYCPNCKEFYNINYKFELSFFEKIKQKLSKKIR